MSLSVDIKHQMGGFTLSASFEAAGEGITSLFGRSGAGKTTVVNILAGLVTPNWGRIRLNGEVLLDTDKRINVPPHKRHVGYVFQDDRLFPHLSVRSNLIYGQRRLAENQRAIRIEPVVELLGINHLMDRKPQQLSGGEKQRVSIGRALLASPKLLLMDEPLSSLDDERKAEIMPYLESLKYEFKLPIIYVSHSVEEVVRLADTLVLLRQGWVTASGPLDEVMNSLEASALTGRNEAGAVLNTTIAKHDHEFGLTHLKFPAGELVIPEIHRDVGDPVRIRVRARSVSVSLKKPHDVSVLNVFKGKVLEIGDVTGPLVNVRLGIGKNDDVPLIARLTFKSVIDLGLKPGTRVYAMIKAVTLDQHGQERII